MLILVDDSAQTLVPSHLHMRDVGRFDDRRRQWVLRSDVGYAPVGTVFVVEGLELSEGLQEVPLVPRRGSIEQFMAAGLHPPLHVGRASIPASLRISHTVEAATFPPRTRSSP